MSLSKKVRDDLKDLGFLAGLSSQQLSMLLALNMKEVHSFLFSHERDFPERLVAFHDIPRGPGLVRSFSSASRGLHFFFDEDRMYEFYDREPLRRGDDLGEHKGVTDSLTIVKKPNLSRFGPEFFSTFLAGLREFLELESKMPLVSVPSGHYVFRHTSHWGAGGIDTSPEYVTRVYIEESLEVALKKFRHSMMIGHGTSVSHVEVAVPGRDNWFLLNNGSEFNTFDIGKLSLPEEIRRA